MSAFYEAAGGPGVRVALNGPFMGGLMMIKDSIAARGHDAYNENVRSMNKGCSFRILPS